MAQYAIDKSHINQLSPEQKEKLRDWWTPEKDQRIMLEKSGRTYTIKGIQGSKIRVGSFKVDKSKVLPALTESELIHSIAENCSEFAIKKMVDDQLPFDNMIWNVATVYEGETLVDALWEAFVILILG